MDEYRIVKLNNDMAGVDFRRFQRGFVAKIVTDDFGGKEYAICYCEDIEEAIVIRDTLNETIRDSIQVLDAIDGE